MNIIDKHLVKKRFGNKAELYDEYAKVQIEMMNRLLGLLRPIKARYDAISGERSFRILEIGCGTGRLTEKLMEQFPMAEITAMDLSHEMIKHARRRVGDRVHFIEADAEAWDPRWFGPNGDKVKWDMIVSNATFQWFETPFATVNKLFRGLREAGCLCFSTFGPNTFRELHQSFAYAERIHLGEERSRHGQSYPSLAKWKEVFQQIGGRGPDEMDGRSVVPFLIEEEEIVERHATVRDFLQSIKNIGATSASSANQTINRRVLLEMINYYESHYRQEEYVLATYHCLYGRLFKTN